MNCTEIWDPGSDWNPRLKHELMNGGMVETQHTPAGVRANSVVWILPGYVGSIVGNAILQYDTQIRLTKISRPLLSLQ